MSHGNEMICQHVTLSGYAEWPKVADAVIEARKELSMAEHAANDVSSVKGKDIRGKLVTLELKKRTFHPI